MVRSSFTAGAAALGLGFALAGNSQPRFFTSTTVDAKKASKAETTKLTIKAIGCHVCRAGVRAAIDQKVTEEDVDDICEPHNKAGRWLMKMDIFDNSDGSVGVEDMEEHGECNKECSVLGQACRKVITDTDQILSMVSAQKSEQKMINKVCKKVCGGKKKEDAKTIVNRTYDEEFKPRDMKELEMHDMMAKMKAETGMGMKMYKREDLENMSEGDMEAMAAREQLAQERQMGHAFDEEM